MNKSDACEVEISKCSTLTELQELWEKHQSKDAVVENFWKSGKLLEYLTLRAFQIGGAEVTYPYSIYKDGVPIEQIDGVLHIDGIHAIIECKDYNDNKINIEPLAKLRNQLMRRHSSVIGLFISMTEITESAGYLLNFMSPQMVLCWGKEDFEFCLKQKESDSFVNCLKKKLQVALEQCEYNYQYYVNIDQIEESPSL